MCSYLLMVLNTHAESIDQDGDHDPSSKVFTVHNLSERVAHQPPEADYVCSGFAQSLVLLFGLSAVPPVPVVDVLSELIHTLAVRVASGLVALASCLRFVSHGLCTVRAVFWVHRQSK